MIKKRDCVGNCLESDLDKIVAGREMFSLYSSSSQAGGRWMDVEDTSAADKAERRMVAVLLLLLLLLPLLLMLDQEKRRRREIFRVDFLTPGSSVRPFARASST